MSWWGGWGNRAQVIMFGDTGAGRATAPLLLEDFLGASLRNNVNDGSVLWQVYQGEGQTQTGALDTVNKAFKATLTAVGGGSGIYIYCNVSTGTGTYPFPSGYMQAQIKSGVWDPATNRISFWIKPDVSMPAPVASSSGQVQFGTYIKQHDCTDGNYQGDHFYNFLFGPWIAGKWTYVVVNSHPQHRRGDDSNLEWPVDPNNQSPRDLSPVSYIAGTVQVTNGSPNIVGTGTNFVNDLSIGWQLQFDQDIALDYYNLRTITDATHAVLGTAGGTQNYNGTSNSGLKVRRATILPMSQTGSNNITVANTLSGNQFGRPLKYFDGFTLWYFDAVNASDFTSLPQNWLLAHDVLLATVTIEPDDLVSNICCVHDGTVYKMSWCGPKNVLQSYTVYYGNVPLQNTDGSYNALGTSGGTASTPNSAYTGVLWTSPALAEAATKYFFIAPAGRSNGTQIVKVQRS